jgi:hypothetical protein
MGVGSHKRTLVEGRKGCGWFKGTKTSTVESGDMMDADTEYHRSGKSELKDANAETRLTLNSPSSAVVQSPRSVRGSYDQAPNIREKLKKELPKLPTAVRGKLKAVKRSKTG